MKLNIPSQIKRLALAFAIFIGLFLVARHFLYPASFGKYGFYRGDSLKDNAAVAMNYAGNAACVECHEDISTAKATDVHGPIRCETCHGAGLKHTENPDSVKLVLPATREFCGICHSKNAARKTDAVMQIELDKHNTGHNCIECHNPHMPWEKMK
jgi:hypothetical protein